MAHPTGPTLIISDGGLPALVAAAIEAERVASAGEGGGGAPALLMPWVTSPILADAQLAAVSSQARFLRQEQLEPAPIQAFAAGTSAAFLDTLGLLAAVEVARANSCARIVWPSHAHATDDSLESDIERIANAVDRALLVERLAGLESDVIGTAAAAEIAIETPLVDLTDSQLAELVVDLDAPAYLCWWWRPVTDPAAERTAAAERETWRAALDRAGWVSASSDVTISAPAQPTPR